MTLAGILAILVQFAVVATIYAIFSLALNVHWGYSGLFNIGVAGFFAVGAYTSALVTMSPATGEQAQYINQVVALGQPFVVGLLAAGLMAGIVAFLIGFPTLRLRDDYLAISTIGIAETIRLIFNTERWLANGARGLVGIPQPLQGLVPPARYNWIYLAIVVVVLILVYIAIERGIRSPWGRVLRAIREDEVVAEAMGKDVFWFKMQAFVVGAVVMGIGGALYAHFTRAIDPTVFEPLFGTFLVWVMLILGGSGNNRGAILGAFIVWGIWSGTNVMVRRMVPVEYMAQAPYIRLMLIGLLLILILLLRPQGILGEEKEVSRLQ
ncbi:branched-chain amino acid ABC transporter permease [Litorilinea aerophila]|uniref:branched-chain amino acid ABC transporter permease n=1 Tax=Litorilinea aerophila TaxID=1204385 RepID=UPI001B87393B|nr:branched-chain amino acid ABC transporter permease [Litorilinea aerophila]MCC9078577.1 branched-chain amino acid ABC transporter permease [Litorilinea aerophila]GIV77096.1 MAG: branched-chain amino acid ABC transporter permease [Litorilinea sp.]